MRVREIVAVLAAAVVTGGCLEVTSLVTVNADGSGTIEHTRLVRPAAPGQPAGPPEALSGSGIGGVLDEDEFLRLAERMGVRPVSLTPVTNGAFEGARAVYAFDDISAVRVDANARAPVTFGFERGANASVLTVRIAEDVASDATARLRQAPPLETLDPAMVQAFARMLEGSRIDIDLQVNGQIVSTNADYVSGSRVTLLEINMTRVLADPARLAALQAQVRPDTTFSDLRLSLNSLQGVKVNHPTVTIEFR